MKLQLLALAGIAIMYCSCRPGRVSAVPPKTQTVLRNSLGMEFVQVPAGEFYMGDSGDPSSFPERRVRMSSFWISKFETTNAQWDQYQKHRRDSTSAGDNEPVSNILFADVRNFIKWLSERDSKTYELPTEAQWECAARGGLTRQPYSWGSEDPEGRANVGSGSATPVGSFGPNGYGLYDMIGNVAELVRESDTGRPTSPGAVDPAGPLVGEIRVARGGSFADFECRLSERQLLDANIPVPSIGFRLVIIEPQK
jgi:formylglycine-generating enzyme required for sulfatase activity